MLLEADADQIEAKAVAERDQFTPQAVGAHLRNLKVGPDIYQQLPRIG